MKKQIIDVIIERVQREKQSISTMTTLVIADLSMEQLREAVTEDMAKSVSQKLRKEAKLNTIASNQLDIFTQMGQIVPTVVRIDDEHYQSGQSSTPNEIIGHLDWFIEKTQTDLGKGIRAKTAWETGTEDKDIPIGAQVGIESCVICLQPFRYGDDWEKAHLYPVGDGTKDQTTDWAHRSCNRSEGQGFRG